MNTHLWLLLLAPAGAIAITAILYWTTRDAR
jgi:hypothetical protein